MNHLMRLKNQADKAIERGWERIFSSSPSFLRRLIVCTFISLSSTVLIATLYHSTRVYFPSLTIITVMLVSLYGGVWIGVWYSVLLSLGNDYFFIPPIGSVLSNLESMEQFFIVYTIGLTSAMMMSSLRSTFKKLTKAKQDAETAKQDAEVANMNKSTFLATISHEIRTPLNGIIGLSDIIFRTPSSINDKKFAKVIHQSGKTLLRIINDILDFSKIESGKFELEVSDFSIGEILDQVLFTLSTRAAEKSISLNYEIDPRLPQTVLGDSDRLSQVLFNLVGNAIKFTHLGSVIVRVKLIQQQEAGVKIRFSVDDTGIGISPEELKVLFTPFVQGKKVGTSGEAGSGLGLSICRNIIRKMGADIQVSSELGHGSTFWFEIIFSNYSTEKTGDVHKFVASNKVNLEKRIEPIFSEKNSPQILVVEDNPTNQIVVQSILTQLGASSIIAANGGEAIDLIKNYKFNTILMDCQMPIMDGFEATKKIREGNIHIPIIAMTANASKEDEEKCLATGMDDFLAKPLSVDELTSVLQKHLLKTPGLSFDTLHALESKIGKPATTKVISSFISTLPEFKNNFELLVKGEDFVGLQRLGHRFKGSALTVGINAFADLCSQMEKSETFSQANSFGSEAIKNLETIENSLKTYLQV